MKYTNLTISDSFSSSNLCLCITCSMIRLSWSSRCDRSGMGSWPPSLAIIAFFLGLGGASPQNGAPCPPCPLYTQFGGVLDGKYSPKNKSKECEVNEKYKVHNYLHGVLCCSGGDEKINLHHSGTITFR